MQDTATEKTPQAPANSECATMSEKQFLRDHTVYSAVSSWLFAIAGATNIGLLSVLSAKLLTAVEKGQPIFRSKDPKIPAVMGNKKYNYIALAMTAFGGACMCVSNWLESKKVVTEWQLGAGKMQRKMNAAEEHAKTSADQAPAAQVSTASTAVLAKTKGWTASVQKLANPTNLIRR